MLYSTRQIGVVLLISALLVPVVVGQHGSVFSGPAAGVADAPPAAGAWIPQNPPTGRDLRAVEFPSDDGHGWAGGEDGTVFRTHDGGKTWTSHFTGLRRTVEDLSFPTATTGYAVTRDFGFARTTDGGTEWEVLWSGGAIAAPRTVHFFNESDGLLLGRDGAAFAAAWRTDDGGETWDWFRVPPLHTESTLHRAHFFNQTHGVAVGWTWDGRGVAVQTDDGGRSWVAVGADDTWDESDTLAQTALLDVAFATPEVGVVVGIDGTVLRTTDAGTSWVPVPVAAAGTLWDVTFINARDGWIVGDDGMVLATHDGGFTWTPEASGVSTTLYQAAFTSSGAGWVVSDAGTVRHRTADLDVIADPEGLVNGLRSPHPSILIVGDDGFEQPGSGVRSGSGTADDPYVIEGWDIAPVAGDGIHLVDTTAHVVIRDNHLHDGLDGRAALRLENADNVRVERNLVNATASGIVATGTSALTLHANVLQRVQRAGIHLEDATDVNVHANRVELSGGSGIRLEGVRNATLANNTLISNRATGIRVVGLLTLPTRDVHIRNHTLEENGRGIHAISVPGLHLEGNLVSLSEREGVLLQRSPDARVLDNKLVGNAEAALRIDAESPRTLAQNNAFDGFGVQVHAQGDEPVIRDNRFLTGDRSITLEGVDGARILENEIRTRSGIDLRDGSDDNVVRDNRFIGGQNAVRIMDGSHRNLVEGNEAWDGARIQVVDGEANVIRRNTLRGGASTLVSLGRGNSATLVEENHLIDPAYGIAAGTDTRRAVIRGNLIEGATTDAIIVADDLDGTLVVNNTIRDAEEVAINVAGAKGVTLEHNRVLNASLGIVLRSPYDYSPVENVTLRHNLIQDSREAGITTLVGPEGLVQHVRILDNVIASGPLGIRLEQAQSIEVHGNNVHGNAVGFTATRATVDATHNWWGASDGPSGDGPGTGDALHVEAETQVTFNPWLTAPNPEAGAQF